MRDTVQYDGLLIHLVIMQIPQTANEYIFSTAAHITWVVQVDDGKWLFVHGCKFMQVV